MAAPPNPSPPRRLLRRGQRHEDTTTVFLVSGLAVTRISRTVLAVTNRVNAVGRNAIAHQIFAHRQRTALAKGAIVFVRPALVTVTFDFYRVAGIAFQIRGDTFNLR